MDHTDITGNVCDINTNNNKNNEALDEKKANIVGRVSTNNNKFTLQHFKNEFETVGGSQQADRSDK